MLISVIGPNADRCSVSAYSYGLELGEKIIENGHFLICGGLMGIMEAVCKGAHQAKNYTFGKTIGILPGLDAAAANDYVDIKIPTGMGVARNIMVANSGEAIIAIAGGAGTLTELAFAWKFRKPVFAVTKFGGWSRELASKDIDGRATGLIRPVETTEEIIAGLEALKKG